MRIRFSLSGKPPREQTGGPRGAPSKRSRRGSALVELTLLAPWFLFLFVGVVDLGFYYYDMIAVENAARVAAEYTSGSNLTASDKVVACTIVKADMDMVPKVRGLANCDSAPLIVTADSIQGPDTNPATSVTVTYNANSLIPIPGLMTNVLTISRNVQMRVKP
jgi:Flp pilus assembly protein TadG